MYPWLLLISFLSTAYVIFVVFDTKALTKVLEREVQELRNEVTELRGYTGTEYDDYNV